MRWLHLSDIHFNPMGDGTTTAQLRKELPLYLSNNIGTVDEVFITGDYRFAKTQSDISTVAEKSSDFVRDLSTRVGVNDVSHIHVVPGNHDLTRSKLDAD